MGGGHGPSGMPRYPYPKWVWSTNGWWPHPRDWRINTAVVIFGLVLINYPIYLFGIRNEKVIIDLSVVDAKAEARRREIMTERARTEE